ncbi:MAG: cytochrome ubiquinol oxidase subunit I, partial [Candidatus Zixiibacteriota bacterium]
GSGQVITSLILFTLIYLLLLVLFIYLLNEKIQKGPEDAVLEESKEGGARA